MAKLKNAPVALIIMDGFGDGDPNDLKYNAIAMAKTPVIDGLLAKYKHNEINASGEYVGLPDGQMGNSEVGHTNIGAGRIVYQQLTRITRDIRNGDFFKNEALLTIVRGVKASGAALHVMGLVSPGGVHSHDEHLFGVLELAKREGLSEVWIHAFLDGRDVPPKSAQEYLEAVEKKAAEIGVGRIATVVIIVGSVSSLPMRRLLMQRHRIQQRQPLRDCSPPMPIRARSPRVSRMNSSSRSWSRATTV